MKSTGVRGMGMRSPDRYAVPLCHDHHINGVERVGSRNEIEWFAKRGVQALDLAAALWGSTGDLAKMTAIVVTNKRGK